MSGNPVSANPADSATASHPAGSRLRQFRNWIVVIGLLAAGAVTAWWSRPPEPPTKVGFVSYVVGEWKCPEFGDSILTGGEELPAGGRLLLPNTGSDAEIRIYFRDGHEEPFRSEHLLPRESGSIMPIRLWNAMREQFSGNVRHESLISREMLSKAALVDGLARLDGEKLELSDVFTKMPGGPYQLLIWSVSPGDQPPYLPGDSPKPAVTVEFTWTPEKPQPAPADQLRPGLYRMEIGDCEDDSLRGGQCHLLVADGPKFASLQRLYSSAVSGELRERLGEDSRSAVLLRRTALEVLARWPGE